MSKLLTTSGYNFESYIITDYLGIYTGECALGTGFLSSLGASFADFLGTNSSKYSDKLRQAKQHALDELYYRVQFAGGDAIIGLDIDYTSFSSDIMGVIANGTAVKIKKIQDLSDSRLEKDSLKEFFINRTNLETPFSPSSIKMTGSSSASLNISLTEPCKIFGVMADLCATSIFGDNYIYKNLPFYGFENKSFCRSTSAEIELIIPGNIMPIIKSWDLTVRKYVNDSAIVEVRDTKLFSPAVVSETDEFKVSMMSAENLITVMEGLNSTREIFDYLVKYNENNGGVLDSHFLSEIQEISSMEGIYGSMRSSALKRIRNYLETNNL